MRAPGGATTLLVVLRAPARARGLVGLDGSRGGSAPGLLTEGGATASFQGVPRCSGSVRLGDEGQNGSGLGSRAARPFGV